MATLRFALAAAALLVVCVHTAPALAAEEPNAVVEGVENRELRTGIERAIGEARIPVETRLQARRRATEAADAAMALLRSEGYYAAVVEPDIGEGERPEAIIRVRPGERFVFTDPQVEWSGAVPAPEAQAAVLEALDVAPGAPGRAADVLAAEGRAVAALQLYGYADAAPEPRRVVVDHADRSVRPTFRLTAGPQVKLGAPRLEARGRTSARWVNWLAPWTPGDLYRPQQVAEFERRLLDTQVYDQVTVALAPPSQADPEGRRPVIVNLADRRARSLELSAGYGSNEGLDTNIRWSVFNRLGRGDTVSVEARYAELGSRFGVDLSMPHWRRPGRTLKLTAEAFRDTTDAYNQTGMALRGDLTHRRGATSYFTRGLSLVKTQVTDKHTSTLDLVALKGLLALAIDRSNDPLDATRGWRAEARLEPTVVTGEDGLIYTRAQAQVSAYLPFDSDGDTVLAGRARLGSIVGGRLSSVPAFDRFYSGGGGSVRGYAYQAVGPRFSDGLPQGGLSLFEASTELRRDFGTFGAVAFVDAGSVATSVNPDFKDVRFAVGLGLRYNLPFAPLRVDVARPLHRPKGDAPFQIYVSIGQAF